MRPNAIIHVILASQPIFWPSKNATDFILRLILSLYIYKYHFQNLEKSNHGK